MMHVPNDKRVTTGMFRSDESYGNNGMFDHKPFTVIASDEMGWEHVSVSRPDRAPTWDEMCKFKNIYWDPEDVVIQYHPAQKDYVNNHPNCLHMWRPIGVELPVPDSILVGIK